jgi:hypothetical protein
MTRVQGHNVPAISYLPVLRCTEAELTPETGRQVHAPATSTGCHTLLTASVVVERTGRIVLDREDELAADVTGLACGVRAGGLSQRERAYRHGEPPVGEELRRLSQCVERASLRPGLSRTP